MKTLLILLFACSTLLLPVNSDAQSVGTKAPDFTVDLLGGGNFTLSDYSGKVKFIFFFGYDCPHCKSNGPNTQEGIYEVYKNNSDFVALGVDTWDGNESGVSSFKETTGITYPLGLMAGELEGLYNTTYDRIIVIDQQDTIRYKSTSEATSSVVADASDVIADLLGMDSGDDMDDKMDDDDMDDMGDDMVTAIDAPEKNENAVKLYPVPTRNQLTIESPFLTEADFNVKIFNMTGETTFETRVPVNESGKISIPMDQQRGGLHVIQMTSPEKTIIRKFLVRK